MFRFISHHLQGERTYSLLKSAFTQKFSVVHWLRHKIQKIQVCSFKTIFLQRWKTYVLYGVVYVTVIYENARNEILQNTSDVKNCFGMPSWTVRKAFVGSGSRNTVRRNFVLNRGLCDGHSSKWRCWKNMNSNWTMGGKINRYFWYNQW
jgi:hypothetical protein